MTDNLNLQERFFKEMREKRIPLVFFNTNGMQIHGLLTDYDDEVVIIEAKGQRQMAYKHALSTVMTKEHYQQRGASLREARQKNDKW